MPRQIAGFDVTSRRVVMLVLIVAALATSTLFYRHIDAAALRERAARLNGPAVFAAVAVLPLVGFPVSVMHAVAGARFGLKLAIPLVALALVLQLLASYGLVRLAPAFFGRRLAPLRARLPQTAHRPLTVFTLLLPGAPFFAQNYVLPLVGVPFRTFFLIAFPLHLARSLIGVLFGEVSDHLTPLGIAGFGLYAVTVTLACAWSFRRLRARLQDPPAAAGDPTRRA
ncbi:MAG: hypothetical protein HYV96_01715 [Opitutae bacterium]|nr:hypothetical protein [Opitutae bacterium]